MGIRELSSYKDCRKPHFEVAKKTRNRACPSQALSYGPWLWVQVLTVGPVSDGLERPACHPLTSQRPARVLFKRGTPKGIFQLIPPPRFYVLNWTLSCPLSTEKKSNVDSLGASCDYRGNRLANRTGGVLDAG